MQLRYHLLDVFTDRPFGGNPVAVFPDGDGVPEATMRAIAAELNISETVFVMRPEQGGTARVRIFTPRMELPFAGHPTIGTAHLLVSIGRAGPGASDGVRQGEHDVKLVLEEGSGPVPVSVRMRDGVPQSARLTAPRLPERGPDAPTSTELAALLGLEERDVLDGEWGPRALSAGVPFLFIAVRDRRVLGRAQVELSVWRRAIADFWAPHLYVITPDAEGPGVALRARMFAPAMGISEDPATGAAASALPGYLAAMSPMRSETMEWRVEQGVEMGRPSLLEVRADIRDGAVTAVHVGGASVMVGEGVLNLPGARD